MREWERRNDENELDYHTRLVIGKLVDKTLSDVDYTELSKEVYGRELSSDVCRRMMYGSRETLQLIEENKIESLEGFSTDDLLKEIEDKKMELYKERVKNSDKLREIRKHLRDEARIENVKDRFIECAEIISKEKPLELNTYPTSEGGRVGILQLSDWHMGEFIENFMNTYNQDVFDDRINKLITETVEYCKLMNVDTLKVLNCGDLISGGLHIGSRISDEEDSVYQTMYVSEAIANMLLEFAKNVNSVEFHSVTDNHSRVSRNKKEHIEKESFSRFIPWHLKTRLRNISNIRIVDNKINDIKEYDIGVFDIFQEKALFTHGHNDKLPSMVQNLTLMTRIFPVAVFTGHLHKNFEDEIHGIDLIMNPSAVGTGEYAKSIRKSSKARQKLTVYQENDGEVERVSTFIINL